MVKGEPSSKARYRQNTRACFLEHKTSPLLGLMIADVCRATCGLENVARKDSVSHIRIMIGAESLLFMLFGIVLCSSPGGARV